MAFRIWPWLASALAHRHLSIIKEACLFDSVMVQPCISSAPRFFRCYSCWEVEMSYLKLHYNIFVDLLEYDFSLAYSESVTSHISILNLRQMKSSIYRMAMLSITSPEFLHGK